MSFYLRSKSNISKKPYKLFPLFEYQISMEYLLKGLYYNTFKRTVEHYYKVSNVLLISEVISRASYVASCLSPNRMIAKRSPDFPIKWHFYKEGSYD